MYTTIKTKKEKGLESVDDFADKIRELMENGEELLVIKEQIFKLGITESLWVDAVKEAYSFEGGDIEVEEIVEEFEPENIFRKYIIGGLVLFVLFWVFYFIFIAGGDENVSRELSRTEALKAQLKALEESAGKLESVQSLGEQ